MNSNGRRSLERCRSTRVASLLRVGLVVLVAAGCSTLKVRSDYDPAFDFTRLQTWRWADRDQVPTGLPAVDTDGLTAARVRRAVEESLAAKGYVQTETSEGDFELAWFLTVQPKTKVTTINDYHGYGGGWSGWYGGPGYGSSTTVVDSYNEGTLIIDVKDGTSSQLIWRGSGSGRLREKQPSPEESEKITRDVVSQILAKFPPPPPTS